jgi:putative MFS transporter
MKQVKYDEDDTIINQILDEQCGFGWFQIRLCFLCCFGYFAVGSELFAMVMTQMDVIANFEIGKGTTYSWLPFSANLASFIAALIVGKIVDKFGRSLVFQICIMMSAVCGVACALAPSFLWLIVFRSVVGFGLGGMTVIDYIVLVEVCPSKWRNIACQIVFVSGCLGVVYVALLGLVDWTSIGIPAWRCMMFAGALPLFVTGLLRVFISVSTPKYLVTTGQPEEAYDLLALIAKTNHRDSLSVPRESFLVQQTYAFARREERGRFSDALKVPGTIPLACLWIIQSLVYWGLTLVLPIFFDLANISSTTSLLCMGFAELPGVAIATLISQYKSRTMSLIACYSLSLTGSILTGLCFIKSWPSAALISSVCLLYMFLIPVWGILFVHTPEWYSVKVRGVAVGFHHMCKSIPSLVAPFIGSAIIRSSFRDYLMFVWAGCILVGLVVAFRFHTLSYK